VYGQVRGMRGLYANSRHLIVICPCIHMFVGSNGDAKGPFSGMRVRDPSKRRALLRFQRTLTYLSHGRGITRRKWVDRGDILDIEVKAGAHDG
jgi:hypothetical protein